MSEIRCRYELRRGELLERPFNDWQHGLVASEISWRIGRWVEAQGLGTVLTCVGCQLAWDPDTVLGTDLAFIRRERLHDSALGEGYWQGGPDVAVEVVSLWDT